MEDLPSEKWGVHIPRVSPLPSIGSTFLDVVMEEKNLILES